MNVTEGLKIFTEEWINVGKEDAGTSAFNQAYDKVQVNQDKGQTKHIMYMVGRKFHDQMNQWQLIIIISTDVQNIYAGVCTDSFFCQPSSSTPFFNAWVKILH